MHLSEITKVSWPVSAKNQQVELTITQKKKKIKNILHFSGAETLVISEVCLCYQFANYINHLTNI